MHDCLDCGSVGLRLDMTDCFVFKCHIIMEKHVYSVLAKKNRLERKERNQKTNQTSYTKHTYTTQQTNNERQDPGCPALRTGAVG